MKALDQKALKYGRQQAGVSLVEIMIALVLGLILTAGVAQIYLSSKQTYRLQEAQSRIQENGRYALEFITRDLRLTGYLGCNSGTNDVTVLANTPLVALDASAPAPATYPYTDTAGRIRAPVVTGGNDNTGGSFTRPAPALWTSPLNTVVIGTDAITVQFAESCNGLTTGALSTTNTTGLIDGTNTCGITVGGAATTGTPLVISDCESAHIFRSASVSSQNTSGATATTSLGKTYLAGSEVMLFRSYTYFIRLNPAGQPALYRIDNTSTAGAVELVEGIENMQITYGVDLDSDGSSNQYVTANNVANWSLVNSVRLVLTVRSVEDNLTSVTRTYNFNGTNNVTDRRLVRNFTATVGLRNRLH